jgi:branched-chain amino acid transport system permease protein
MAIAMVLVWRSTRVVNFAQAGMALLSTYIGYELIQVTGNFWISLPWRWYLALELAHSLKYF